MKIDRLIGILSILLQQECAAFQYCSPYGEMKREIEPNHLVFQWANWYVWGWCREELLHIGQAILRKYDE